MTVPRDLGRPDAETTWRTDHPTDVVLTLSRLQRGGPDPTHRVVDARTLWRTTLTPDGPATMLLTQVDLHTVPAGAGARARAPPSRPRRTRAGRATTPPASPPGTPCSSSSTAATPGCGSPARGGSWRPWSRP